MVDSKVFVHSRDCWVSWALLLRKSRNGDGSWPSGKFPETEQKTPNKADISLPRLFLQAASQDFFLNSFYIYLTCKLPAWDLIGILLFCCSLMLLRNVIFVLSCAAYRKLHKYLGNLRRGKKERKPSPRTPNLSSEKHLDRGILCLPQRKICLTRGETAMPLYQESYKLAS